ncbi:cadherin-related family member 5-like [Clinocottus analis]|uniref:cadherin-related family member 5-like n=1 Tax=Clinocottus analis TaxID=304258 RepID=UPI0035C21DDB
MDGIQLRSTAKTSFCFLLLVLLRSSAAQICSAPQQVEISENNAVGDVVVLITVQPNVTLEFKPAPANPNNPFGLVGNELVAERVLDYEFSLLIFVVLINMNDNRPVFDQNPYRVDVNEMSPIGTTVRRIAATDLDGTVISYTLTPESSGFMLKSPNNPDLLVETPLDYDKVRNVELVLIAEDTFDGVSFTATTTILVTIVDVDNRPPWFQPCSKHEVGGLVICQSAGYTGRVDLNEQETGALPLEPGPLYAIDGDSGINGEVTYSFLGGDAGGLFQINPNTGNITMLKPADKLGTLSLTVLAAQTTNRYQFSTAVVTFSVLVKSLHRPQFQRPQYDAVVTAVGVMATDPTAEGESLRILATDDDYAATAGINPHITYSVNGSSDFSVIAGYLFMTTDLPEGSLSLQLLAVDATNGETAEAPLLVEVTAGPTTTSLPVSTADSGATTSGGESSTGSETTAGGSTSDPPTATSDPSTAIADTTSESGVSTADPSVTMVAPAGGFGPADMAALGATLGVLLLASLGVVLGLALRLRRGDADRRKIFEASVFQSALVQGGQKGGVQYTNEAFQNDDNDGGGGGGGPAAADFQPTVATWSMPQRAFSRDGDDDDAAASQAGSDGEEKEVRPILTKERRSDDGYKSVWFKEDIDPDAKEEVVIIPDSREDDSEEEDEDDNDNGRPSRVMFNDADMDSGLGVKMEDPDEDSDGDEELTVDL